MAMVIGVGRATLTGLLAIAVILFSTCTTLALNLGRVHEAETSAALLLDLEAIERHVEVLAGFGTRVTGYEGTLKAAGYIRRVFEEYGLEVFTVNYTIAMPIDEGSWIVVEDTGDRIEAFSLWPNGPQACTTPPNGISGRLVYIGDGSFDSLEGKDLEGAIVLMDFNSGDNWIRAVDLGARAIIFVEPEHTTSLESFKKAVSAPLYAPRLYVKRNAGLRLVELAEKGVVVRLFNNIKWREVRAVNVVGVVRGAEKPDEVVIVSAHYDSWSVVPRLAPGAEDAVSIASLLEMAKLFAHNRPLRTIWFTAFSGYYQALAGPINFVEQVFYSPEIQSGEVKILLHLGIDLSSEDRALDALYTGPPSGGWLRGEWGPAWYGAEELFAARYSGVESSIKEYLAPIIDELRREVGKDPINYNFLTTMQWGTQPVIRDYEYIYKLDTMPAIQTGVLGFVLRTQWSYRYSWFTPLNDIGEIAWDNLIPQLKAALRIVEGFANERGWNIETKVPTRFYAIFGAAYFLGFITLNVRVVEYNMSIGWYTPVSGALVRIMLGDANEYLLWPFNSWYKFSDENGIVKFYGLIPYRAYMFDAWKFDEEGRVSYAVDEGIYGTSAEVVGGISNIAIPVAHPYNMLLPVFKCTEVTVFDLIDIRMMRYPRTAFIGLPSQLNVYDYATKSNPIFYGTYLDPNHGIGLVFVKKGSRIVVTFNPNPAEVARPLIILTNSTPTNTEGYGLSVHGPLIVYKTCFQAARDMYLLTIGRYGELRERNVRNTGVEHLLEGAEEMLSKAEKAFNSLNYEEAVTSSLAALAYLARAYNEGTMPLINESATFLLFFAPLTMMFSILFERLVLHGEGLRRILNIAILLVLSMIALNILSPVFKIVKSSFIAVLGVGTLLLSVFIVMIFLREAKDLMEYIAVRKLGAHLVKMERTAAIIYSLGVAVDNLRRRPLTTITALATIMVITAALTTFTSASYAITATYRSIKAEPPYTGLLVKRLWGVPPDALRGGSLDYPILLYLKGIVGDEFFICPRVWLYPISVYPVGVTTQVRSSTGVTRSLTPFAIYGMSLVDVKTTFSGYIVELEEEIFNVTGRACIITSGLAQLLNVTIGDEIELYSPRVRLVVAGIVAIPSGMLDLDARYVVPIDPFYSSTLSRMEVPYSESAVPAPIEVDKMIIVPWRTAWELGGFIPCVVLIPKGSVNGEFLEDVARRVVLGVDANAYVGYGDTVSSFSRVVTFQFGGWDVASILLILAVLSVINNLLATVYERRREIYVYAALGVSPLSAALMFLVESMTYGIIASVLGYLLGYGMTIAFMSLHPGLLAFNITSLFIAVSLLAILGACIAASVYPSILAAKMITPSLERRWKPPTKPRGDVWELPLPLRTPTEEEAIAVLNFLKEYYLGAGAEKRGFIIRRVSEVDQKNLSLSLFMYLTPSELNITQETLIYALRAEDNYVFFVKIVRKSGNPPDWVSRCYYYITDLWQQILLWRTLPLSERRKYMGR